MGEQLGLRLDGLRKALFHRARDLFVVLLRRALEQRLVGCILNQRMLEDVASLRRFPALIEQLGVNQLGECLPQARRVEG
jgi:hypothetical protein